MADSTLTGVLLLAGAEALGEATGPGFRAINPASGAELEPLFHEASESQVDTAAKAAAEAFGPYRRTHPAIRAAFLRTIADGIDASTELADRIHTETGIATARIEAERIRTSNQLRTFADVVDEGTFEGARIDSGDPTREPLPKPDLRHRFVPIGPVAVFGASNFPLAFSVAGGDTAAAFAAGCPVVIKAHEAHPGTSEIVGRIITDAIAHHDLPPGTFSLIHGRSPELAVALVKHPAITAVGFTGSRHAGLALVAAAQARAVPIPVYAEMASVNPVFVLPGAVAKRGEEIGEGLIGSVLMGFGQLCTSPGLVFVPDGAGATAVRDAAAYAIANSESGCMLTPRIAESFSAGVDRIARIPDVRQIATALPATGSDSPMALCRPTLFETDLATFLDHRDALSAEVFGSVTLLVRVPADPTEAYLATIPDGLEGQLTVTIHAEEEDHALAGRLVERLELTAGRIVFNGWPTGLEVNDAVIHGGPYPATSAPGTTSVGTRAIERFLRPVAYQNAPAAVLPSVLSDAGTGAWRRVNGTMSTHPVSS